MPRLFLSLLVAFAASTALAQGTSETLTLRSATYSNFRQILTRASPDGQADLPAILNLPVTSSGRLPAVIVVHTLAGFRDQNEGWQAQRLREAGFATLTYDSFAARGMGDLVTTPRRGPPPYPSALADAFAALAGLSRDPRIDPQRIAILGFSFGGEVAHVTAFERIQATLAKDRERFGAHVAFYPAGVYGVVAEENAYTGAPILIMVGDDDTLPAAKAEAYLAYEKASGHPAPIELVTYAGANHGWTDPGIGPARDFPYLASTRKCPLALITPHQGLQFLVDGEARPFDDKGFEACIRDNLGYTMGYNEAVRRQSTDAAIAFLKRYLAP
jgi:dienelactone hydrolase